MSEALLAFEKKFHTLCLRKNEDGNYQVWETVLVWAYFEAGWLAAASAAPAQEPFAWLIESNIENRKIIYAYQQDAKQKIAELGTATGWAAYEITPLYTAPVPAQLAALGDDDLFIKAQIRIAELEAQLAKAYCDLMDAKLAGAPGASHD